VSQFYRYLVVGALNTAWGYLLIFAFMYGAGWSPESSNVMGYAIGLVTSYALNRRFTFRSRNTAAPEFVRFLATFAAAFAANFVVLMLLVRVLGVHEAMAQLLAGVVYVATSYLLSRSYVFRRMDPRIDT
jgi:putative flippase GtrA